MEIKWYQLTKNKNNDYVLDDINLCAGDMTLKEISQHNNVSPLTDIFGITRQSITSPSNANIIFNCDYKYNTELSHLMYNQDKLYLMIDHDNGVTFFLEGIIREVIANMIDWTDFSLEFHFQGYLSREFEEYYMRVSQTTKKLNEMFDSAVDEIRFKNRKIKRRINIVFSETQEKKGEIKLEKMKRKITI